MITRAKATESNDVRNCVTRGEGGPVPKRPLQHQIGARAESAVRSLWLELGHAVDEIREDYGEDLLIQTSLNGRVDPCRIWVQVKGTKKDCSQSAKSLPSLSLRADQILRWSRSADLVVIVLWDVGNDCGWYMIPRGKYDDARLQEAERGKLKLEFDRTNSFDRRAVEHLAWRARIDHANRSLKKALFSIEEARDEDPQPLDYLEFHGAVAASLVVDFGVDIGAFTPSGDMTSQFRRELLAAAELQDEGTDIQVINRALLTSLVKLSWENCAENGLPSTLLVELTDVIREVVFGEILSGDEIGT
ncbi:DUF4365 domain-containing protein [Streptomyces antibioticus]|uniref:DUF4365 domain-containing protein n=1 Tax=Streptomyces antibioticus TaxID=1890 RepID=UPI00371329C9